MAGADLALNAVLGVSTFMGIGSSVRSVKAAWAMRGMGTAERLNYLRGIAEASGVTVEMGEAFFRPLGQRVIVVPEGAVGNPWRLAGGFYHEMAHVTQEFGTPVVLRWIPRGMQRMSEWVIGGMNAPAWKQFIGMATPLYAMNPVEMHAATSGLAFIKENVSLWLLGRLWSEGVGSILRYGR